jgi:hypothetical protein
VAPGSDRGLTSPATSRPPSPPGRRCSATRSGWRCRPAPTWWSASTCGVNLDLTWTDPPGTVGTGACAGPGAGTYRRLFATDGDVRCRHSPEVWLT